MTMIHDTKHLSDRQSLEVGMAVGIAVRMGGPRESLDEKLPEKKWDKVD